MDLDEVATPFDLGTQGAATFQFTVDLPFERLYGFESVPAGLQALERLSENQLHAHLEARITSAAFFGIEYRSALSA